MARPKRRRTSLRGRVPNGFRIKPCPKCYGTPRLNGRKCDACRGAGRYVLSGPSPRAIEELQVRLASEQTVAFRKWSTGGDRLPSLH